MDQRALRTRERLRDALLTLMLEKGYDAINVQDITDRAGLGRATFYLHYKDKDEALFAMVEDLYNDLSARIEAQVTVYAEQAPPPIQLVFEHAVENKELYQAILSGTGKTAVLNRTRDYIVTMMVKSIQSVASHPKIPLEVTAVYLAGAQMQMIGWWLENNMPYTIDEMVAMYQQLTIQGVVAMLGIEKPLWRTDRSVAAAPLSQATATGIDD